MYKKILEACCFLAASLGVQAQSPMEKGLQSISREKAEAIVDNGSRASWHVTWLRS